MTLSVYLNRLDLWNIWTMRCHEMPGTFWRHCSQSCVYSDEATWHLRWRNMSSNHWKWHFQDSKFQNVRRCFGPQELVPLVRVPKLPTIHYQPATWNGFDSPGIQSKSEMFIYFLLSIYWSLTKYISQFTHRSWRQLLENETKLSSMAVLRVTTTATYHNKHIKLRDLDTVQCTCNIYWHTKIINVTIWAQLFKGRLALNPRLNLTRVSFSCV